MSEDNQIKITIKNFKGIIKQNLRFNNHITLIKGDSGKGKTTIFEAIKWCLYGGTRIFPLNVKTPEKSFTKVTLKTNEIKVTRTKPPDEIKVSLKDSQKEYTGDEAQNIINQTFGTKNFWIATSYLGQFQRNPLISLPNQEKIELIKEIIFNDLKDNPTYYQEKIKNYIEQLEKEKLKKTAVFEHINSKFLIEFEENEQLLNQDIIFNQNEQLLKEEITKTEEELKKSIKLKTLKENIEKSKEELKKNTRKFNSLEYHDVNLINKIQEYIKLQKQLNEIENFEKNYINLKESKKELYNMINSNKLYEMNYLRCVNLNISYNKEKITEIINKLEKEIEENSKINYEIEENNKCYLKKVKFEKELENTLKIYQTYSNNEVVLKNELEEIKQKFDFKETSIEELIKYIKQLSKETILKCPDCKTELIFENSTLKKSEKYIPKEQATLYITKLNKIKEFFQNYEILKENINKLKIEVEKYKECNKKEKVDVKNLLIKLNEYKEIEFHDYFEETKINTLKQKIKDRELTIQYEEIQTKINNLKIENINFEEIQNINFEKLKEEIYTLQTLIQTHKNVIKQENNLRDFEEPEKLEIQLKKIKEEYDKASQNNREYLKVKKLRETEEEIKRENNEILKLGKRIENSYKIKQTIEEVTNKTIETLLFELNIILNKYLNLLFDDAKIELQLFKKVKTKDILKPNFNVNLRIGNITYENLNDLSGGETDRLSLCITLGLSMITCSKFLLLDECMSSMHSELRETCLEILKENFRKIPIINICHETTEGYYDEVIDL